jgi:hypothetical protein
MVLTVLANIFYPIQSLFLFVNNFSIKASFLTKSLST